MPLFGSSINEDKVTDALVILLNKLTELIEKALKEE